MDGDRVSINIGDHESWEQRRARLKALEPVKGTPLEAEFKYRVYMLLRHAVEEGNVEEFIRALEKHSAEGRVSLSDIINIRGPSGDSLLHVAAGNEKTDVLQALLEGICDKWLTANVNYRGDTVLHVAAREGKIHTAELLLGYGSILDMANDAGNTALHEAVKNGNYKLTDLLLHRGLKSVNKMNKESKCPLYLAVEKGDSKIFKLLMEALKRDEVLPSQIEGMSPVHGAVIHKKRDMLKVMSEQNEDLFKLRDAGGGTPLHLAALMDYVEGVKFLVGKFAWSAFEFDGEGYLPIHVACKMGCLETIKELLQHWSNPEELLDLKKGQNILHVAANYGMDKVVTYILTSPKLLKLINAKDKEGNTPLHVATLQFQDHIVARLLFSREVNLQLVNNDNLTALDIAIERQNGPRETSALSTLAAAGARRSVYKAIGQPEGLNQVTYLEPQHLERLKDVANIRMLVATLIAGMTFTAGFSVPGGYNGSGPDAGFATLLNKPMYDVFVICNTIGLYSSVIAVAILHWAETFSLEKMFNNLRTARTSVVIALVATSVAYMAGVYVTVSKRSWIAVVALIVGITALFVILSLHYVLTAGFLFKLKRVLLSIGRSLIDNQISLTKYQAKLRARRLAGQQAAAT
ncbi:hypothetical protein BT93_L0584 [Corymbia citriodora subsp. variegata]|uniref:PGG domain-containing protein n=1 Tax=Corymbia citriodora subsp. variegata TaxID=360336 RepID=A0A8T0D0C4_CORYI|nr:hypothetical protein BT93_L0584 [Corymbia citriodora subsp. variegata]